MKGRDERIAEALSLLKDVPDAERLLAILSQAPSQPASTDGPFDLSALGREAEMAAALLISTYGEGALERARLLEKRSSNYFSRLVRQRLEEAPAAKPSLSE